MKKPLTPRHWTELASEIATNDPARLLELMTGSAVNHKGRYLHWDQMRHREPPDGLTLEEWWVATAASRSSQSRQLPFTGTDAAPFWFVNTDQIQKMVHRIDQQASGQIQTDDVVATVGSSDRYVVSSLVEEAITSSLLEGAATTRRAAKQLLLEDRQPRDRSDRMVVNNYQAMLRAEELANSGDTLTPNDVMELHRIVTEGTLDEESDDGRLQQPGETRVAVTWHYGEILHMPPPAEELPARLEQLCAFANGETDEGFLHPVVRAVLVHFWLGYDHPFVDGNGRTARALFYWLMLRSGYWLAQYISISSILRKAPTKYARAYLYAETDSNDATYFVIHQLEAILQGIEALREYLSRKTREISEVETLLRDVPGLNHRQLATLGEALRRPDLRFTITGQRRKHRVTYQSARTDLLGLENLGLFEKHKVGKRFEFRAVPNLADHLLTLSEQPANY